MQIKTILGIDEAGRGPVLGPLVMAGALVEQDVQQQLAALGVKDSKLLSAAQREDLYPRILALVKDYKIIILQPDVIDAALKDTRLNLNWLEANTSADIINELAPDEAIVDCPSPNIAAYQRYVEKRVGKRSLRFEHHAERHIPVAAASILAKVTRDRIIEGIKKEIGIDVGSGYLHDEKTQAFLEKHYETHRALFRTMWLPYQQRAAMKHQKRLGEF